MVSFIYTFNEDFDIVKMHRLIFEKPLPFELQPSMFILLVPPALGFVSLTTLQPEVDTLAIFLFYNSVFIFIVLIIRLPEFIKLPFKFSSWAFSFPLAAMCIASFRMFELENIKFIDNLSWALTFMLIIWLVIKTIIKVFQNGINIDKLE